MCLSAVVLFVSAVTFDKFTCKSYLKDTDFIKCAEDFFIRKGDDIEGLAQKVTSKLGLPLLSSRLTEDQVSELQKSSALKISTRL